ncbi:putative aspartate transaminase [Enterococcus faecalis TX1467]|nr:putative aspartate transaminase [Enterococcus faecalis TX1467]
MNVSNRAQQLTPSVTLAAAAKAKALKAKGVDVLSLTVGEPDFVTPKNIQKAAIASIEDGRASYYTPSGGIPELKQAIVSYVEREYQLRYQPKQVIVTDGAKYALYLLFQAILNVGDEVIIPVPYWVSYGEQVKLAEGKPVFVSSTQEQSFKVSVAQLEAVRTDKTKAIILNSPSNPTGVIYTEEELRQLVNGQLLIISSLLQMIFMVVWCTMDIGSHQLQPSQKQFVNRQSLLMVFPKHMQ